jgi:enamine deaminase RidA (YjgF/YER057c/UK114 family)
MLSQRLEAIGIHLPPPPKPVAAYIPAVRVGSTIYVSGQLPLSDGQLLFTGSVPTEVSVEHAQMAARQCLLNGIAAAGSVSGGIEKLGRLIQINGFVQSEKGFSMHPQVINGASELALELMGDAGKHARIAVGVSSLPLNAPVEISFIFEMAPEKK